MKKINQSGFSAVEAILMIVVLCILGSTSYFVYHSRQNTDNLLSATDNDQVGIGENATTKLKPGLSTSNCAANDKHGFTYVDHNSVGSVCLPNGLQLTSVIKSGSTFTILDAKNVTFSSSNPVLIVDNSDCCSDSQLTIIFSKDREPVGTSFTKVDTLTAVNATGTIYEAQQGKVQAGLPKGTILYAFYFVKDGKSIEIGYNQEPQESNYLPEVEAMARTIRFL